MPEYKGVRVKVINAAGEPFDEYGHQSFPRLKTVSCHIEAKTGVRFCISITPDPTFFDGNQFPKSLPSSSKTSSKDASLPNPNTKELNTHGKDSTGFSTPEQISMNPPKQSTLHTPPPFDLLAWMYIDGCETAESGTLVRLDPLHVRYKATAILRCRLVQETDGTIGQRTWVFTDTGVQDVSEMLANLDVSKNTKVEARPDDHDSLEELNQLMGNAGFNCAGKIVIEVKRVVPSKVESSFRPRFEAIDDNGDAGTAAESITLKPRIQDDMNETIVKLRAVTVEPYQDTEDIYARFEFRYTSRSKLLALNMMNDEGEAVSRKDWAIKDSKSSAGTKRSDSSAQGLTTNMGIRDVWAQQRTPQRHRSLPELSPQKKDLLTKPRP